MRKVFEVSEVSQLLDKNGAIDEVAVSLYSSDEHDGIHFLSGSVELEVNDPGYFNAFRPGQKYAVEFTLQ